MAELDRFMKMFNEKFAKKEEELECEDEKESFDLSPDEFVISRAAAAEENFEKEVDEAFLAEMRKLYEKYNYLSRSLVQRECHMGYTRTAKRFEEMLELGFIYLFNEDKGIYKLSEAWKPKE